MRFSAVLLSTFALANSVLAHPGAEFEAELLKRKAFLANAKRIDLSHCTAQNKARGLEQRRIERRNAIAREKSKRGLIKRDSADINKNHLSNAPYGAQTPLDIVFGTNASCVLSLEVVEGPYYVTGESILRNIVEKEPGIPLVVDLAIYNTTTCKPTPDLWVEIWACNSTGIYSGVASGQSDKDGALQFEAIFPGHYSGRAQHIHIMMYPNATARENLTISDSTASHVGQMYFDQDLIDAVEKFAPYNTNTQAITVNFEDAFLASGLETSDPIMQYVLLGDSVEDGILSRLSFGIDPDYATTIYAAAARYKEGGVANNETAPIPSGITPP
ncbi:Intradiol ring-cleavage dioxygenase [Fusarium tricinctum]|uniref:Intradiol ring-cleavage dioxygenase n=1 Tax=Fusarium tricinctum TaxID=61284 RepID=A0A8K0WFZ7_9HYPO|nr:Intradiol ring-cleavage dioxygenase [Fusarium tricinctum]